MAVVSLAAAVVVGIAIGDEGRGGAGRSVDATTVAAATPAASSLTARDQAFLASMRRLGMTLSPELEPSAVATAKGVCAKIAGGKHALIVMDEVHSEYSGLSTHQAGGYVGGAIGAYCPQFNYQIGLR